MSTLAIVSPVQATVAAAKSLSAACAALLHTVQVKLHPVAPTLADKRAQGVRQLRRLAQKFDQIDPDQAAELRWLAGRG